APAPARRPQRKVRPVSQLAARGTVLRGDRQPEVCADLDHLVEPIGSRGRVAGGARDRAGLLGAACANDQTELFAAQSSDRGPFSNRGAQAIRDLLEETVLFAAAESILPVMEPAKVEEYEGHHLLAAPAGKRVVERLEKVMLVRQPGDRVCVRELVHGPLAPREHEPQTVELPHGQADKA